MIAGRGRFDPSTSGSARLAGRNFRIRNSIVATGSLPAYHVLIVVTNQPSPSDVRFGPVTLSSRDRTSTCSPCRR